MKVSSVKCPNCGAPVDLDIDNLQKFCSSCGSKLLLDAETIQQLLIEKEKTKQIEIQADSKVRMIEEERKSRMAILAEEKRRQAGKTIIILSIIGSYILSIIIVCILGNNGVIDFGGIIVATVVEVVVGIGLIAGIAYSLGIPIE